jgi:hypothetical protein
MLKIAICIPSRGAMDYRFTYDLVQLVMYTQNTIVDAGQADFGVLFRADTYIHRNRESLAEMALRKNATHLLWLDDDMRFPPDLLVRLLAHQKPIVGVNYVTRGVEAEPVAITQIAPPGAKLQTPPDATGLAPVEALGFGAVLIESAVFTATTRPWFESCYKGTQHYGEDVDFCMKARAAGYEVLVDQDLSKQIAHLGSFEYRMEHAWAVQEAANGAE